MTTATLPGLRQLTDTELAESWHVGALDLATLERECARRDRADHAKRRADADRSAWYDAAHAQYLAADAECAGNLLSELGNAEGISREMALWTGSDAWADRRASEELRNFWERNGGRLSLANYRRQQAMQARAYRDERDLDAMPAAPMPAPRPATVRAPRPVMRPVTAPRPAGSIARYITALSLLERQADRTARALARVTGGVPR